MGNVPDTTLWLVFTASFLGGTTLARLASRSGIRVRARDMVRERMEQEPHLRNHGFFDGGGSSASHAEPSFPSAGGLRRKFDAERLGHEPTEEAGVRE